jgi:hypothetical protein
LECNLCFRFKRVRAHCISISNLVLSIIYCLVFNAAFIISNYFDDLVKKLIYFDDLFVFFCWYVLERLKFFEPWLSLVIIRIEES